MKRDWLIVSALMTVWFVACNCIPFGCIPGTRDTATDKTVYHLRLLGKVAIAHDIAEIEKFNSLMEFVASARSRRLLDPIGADRCLYDGWGEPFRWEVIETSDRRSVRVISTGRNKQYDDAKGDDLWLEIKIRHDGTMSTTIHVTRKWPGCGPKKEHA